MKTEEILIGAAVVGLGAYAINRGFKNAGDTTSYQSDSDSVPFEATQKTIRKDLRQAGRTDRLDLRKDAQVEKVGIKQDERTARTEIRQDNRTERTAERQKTLRKAIDAGKETVQKVLSSVKDVVKKEPNFSSVSGKSVYVSAPKSLRTSKVKVAVQNTLSKAKSKVSSVLKKLRGKK